jgi:hypothetical protein
LGQLVGSATIQATSGNVSFTDLSLTNASAAAGGITLTASNENSLTIGGAAVLDSGTNIDINALSAGRISVGNSVNAVADGTITLSNGNGAGSIQVPTLMLFGNAINTDSVARAQLDITNLIAHLNGDFTIDEDLSVPGFLSLSAGGNLTAANMYA